MSIQRMNIYFEKLPEEIKSKLNSIGGKDTDLSRIFIKVHSRKPLDKNNKIELPDQDKGRISEFNTNNIKNFKNGVRWGIDKYTGLFLIIKYCKREDPFKKKTSITKYSSFTLYQRNNTSEINTTNNDDGIFLNPNDRDFFERFEDFLTTGLKIKKEGMNYKISLY
jgi:hypothetical protein